MRTNLDVVANVDEIVEKGTFTDHGVSESAPIDAGVRPDIGPVSNTNPAKLRYSHVSLILTGEHEPETVLTDAGTRMDADVGANNRAYDRNVGVDPRTRSQYNPWADRGIGSYPCPRANFGVRADYCPGLNAAVLSQRRTRINNRPFAHAGLKRRCREQRRGDTSKRQAWIGRRQTGDAARDFRRQYTGRHASSRINCQTPNC